MRKTLLNIGNSYLFTGIVVAIDKDFGYEVLDDEWSADDGTQPHAVTGVENEDYVIASSAQTVAYNPWGKVSGIYGLRLQRQRHPSAARRAHE